MRYTYSFVLPEYEPWTVHEVPLTLQAFLFLVRLIHFKCKTLLFLVWSLAMVVVVLFAWCNIATLRCNGNGKWVIRAVNNMSNSMGARWRFFPQGLVWFGHMCAPFFCVVAQNCYVHVVFTEPSKSPEHDHCLNRERGAVAEIQNSALCMHNCANSETRTFTLNLCTNSYPSLFCRQRIAWKLRAVIITWRWIFCMFSWMLFVEWFVKQRKQ